MIQIDNKYSTGQLVEIKATDNRLRIVQIETVTCPAGTQTYYAGRVHTKHKPFGESRTTWSAFDKMSKFNEVELGELVNEQNPT